MTTAVRLSKIDMSKLYSISYKYLLKNFKTFSEHNKIKVALRLMDKYADTLLKENNAGDTNITTYINNIVTNGGTASPEEQQRRNREAHDVFRQALHTKQSV